ncbi:MAG: hypothetical protein ACD_62C00189G0002 [uncultured bacterium]|nr:MAG: hypothetical protein ACD_62C00189G0002 [uncultured bacterium]
MGRDLKNIFESLVKIDNILVWDGTKRPFFESYYLNATSQDAKWGTLLRYTLSTSTAKQVGDTATVLCLFVDSQGNKVVAKESFDLLKHDIVHSDRFISLGSSYLSISEMAGSAQDKKVCIKWDITFEDPVISSRLTSPGILYHRWFANTKFLQPRALGYGSGTLYVDGHKKELKRARLHQGHLYGTAYTQNWIQGNCESFQEDSEAFFNAVSFKRLYLKKFSRTLTLCAIGMEGKKFVATSPVQALFCNKTSYADNTWTLQFTCRGYRFICRLKRRPELTAGVRHSGINGSQAYFYHCPLADVEIKVYKKNRGAWLFYKTLSAQGRGSFETMSSEKEASLSLTES